MANTQTSPDPAALAAFLAALPEPRASEAARLIQIFAEVSGFAPVLWGSMVGFGRYDYTYDSGHSGSFFATGFAPRKAELVIYTMPGYDGFAPILQDLGKHRLGKSCLYLRRLDDANPDALRRLIRAGLDDLASRWQILPQ